MDDNTKSCPYCGNEIKKEAIKCRYCGKFLNREKEEITSFDSETISAKEHIIYGILCLIFIFASVALYFGIEKLDQTTVKIVSTIMTTDYIIFAILLMPKVKRLVITIARNILDYITALDALSALIILSAGVICSILFNNWWIALYCLLGSIVYYVLMLTKDYVLYLLVDIRDNLEKIANNKNKE